MLRSRIAAACMGHMRRLPKYWRNSPRALFINPLEVENVRHKPNGHKPNGSFCFAAAMLEDSIGPSAPSISSAGALSTTTALNKMRV